MSEIQPIYTGSQALVIGINSYDNPRFIPLGKAEDDAQQIGDLLADTPFHFKVTRLLGENATRQAILKELFNLRTAASNDRLLVYFAGHGYTLTDRFGKETGYLAAFDTIPEQDFTALEMDEVTGLIRHASAKHIAFIFDACFSGQALGLTRAPAAAAGKFMTRRAYQVISAGAGDQTVSDYRSMTSYLINALTEGVADTDGMVTFSEIGLYLQQNIAAESGQTQIPQFGHIRGSQGGDFVFYELTGARLPAALESVLRSGGENSRLGAVVDLIDIANAHEDDLELARLAHDRLKDIAQNDPSERVSKAAKSYFYEHTRRPGEDTEEREFKVAQARRIIPGRPVTSTDTVVEVARPDAPSVASPDAAASTAPWWQQYRNYLIGGGAFLAVAIIALILALSGVFSGDRGPEDGTPDDGTTIAADDATDQPGDGGDTSGETDGSSGPPPTPIAQEDIPAGGDTQITLSVIDEMSITVEVSCGIGFDAPVGTDLERASDKIWPGSWHDATGFATFFSSLPGGAYSTGADLNLPDDADAGMPVYAPADGTVTFANRGTGTWGNIIVIRHDPLADGTVVWSRMAPLDEMRVVEGDRVTRGQEIGTIGNADGQLAYYLGFDIAQTDVLETNPSHWPGSDLDSVLRNYVDPGEFVAANRPSAASCGEGETTAVADASAGVIIMGDGSGGVTLYYRTIHGSNALFGHRSPVTAVAISADGNSAVSAALDGEITPWSVHLEVPRGRIEGGHTEPVRAIAIADDGSTILTGSYDNTAIWWDGSEFSIIHTLDAHGDDVTAVAISPDGSRALTGSANHSIIMWDRETGNVIYVMEGHLARIAGLAFSADGATAVSASWDRTLGIWDVASGELRQRLEAGDDALTSVDTHPNQNLAVTGSVDGTVRVWNLETGEMLGISDDLGGPVSSVAFTGVGDNVVALVDGRLIFFQLDFVAVE